MLYLILYYFTFVLLHCQAFLCFLFLQAKLIAKAIAKTLVKKY